MPNGFTVPVGLTEYPETKHFTPKHIMGSWAYWAEGVLNYDPANPVSFVAIGVATFDGKNQCTISNTFNTPSGPITFTETCAYAVKPDGTGKIDLEANVLGSETTQLPVTFVIVDDRSEFRFIGAGVNYGTGVARRQHLTVLLP